MSLGYDIETRVVNQNDTADLTAALYDVSDKPVPADRLVAVTFVVQKPDQTKTSVTGAIRPDGSGAATFNGTDQVGHHTVVATFTDVDGKLKSARADIDVVDPFETNPNFSASYLVATQIWAKIEDCFVAGTPVSLASGDTVPIETLEVGDQILDAYQEPQTITRVVSRPEHTAIYDIHRVGYGTARTIQATHNHPFLVIRQPRSNAWLDSLTTAEVYDLAEWCRAEDLQSTDWLLEVYPVHSEGLTHIIPNDLIRPAQRTPKPLPEQIALDRKFGAWVGWYLAEGCTAGRSAEPRSVVFGLHRQETAYIDELLALGKDLFDLTGTVTRIGATQGVTVTFYSTYLARLMALCGSNVLAKQLPSEWLHAPIEFLEALTEAHAKGDGYYSASSPTAGNRHDHCTSSEVLADQLLMLLRWLGHVPNISIDRPSKLNKRTVPGYKIYWYDRKSRPTGRVIKDQLALVKIAKVAKQAYSGDVFCVDVTGSHTFLAHNVAVHNCFDAELEGPWLREMTLNTFNREKMESFLDMAFFDINQLNPPTTLGLTDFVHTDPVSGLASSTVDLPLIVQGGYIVCLRHLMASYAEQPQPAGAATQVGWQDRRDYLQRWATVYTIEFSVYDRMAKLYKRRFLGLGKTAGLLSSKAGRLIPAPMRTRSIGRGYW